MSGDFWSPLSFLLLNSGTPKISVDICLSVRTPWFSCLEHCCDLFLFSDTMCTNMSTRSWSWRKWDQGLKWKVSNVPESDSLVSAWVQTGTDHLLQDSVYRWSEALITADIFIETSPLKMIMSNSVLDSVLALMLSQLSLGWCCPVVQRSLTFSAVVFQSLDP